MPLDAQKLVKIIGGKQSPWRLTPDQRLVRNWVGDKERSDRLALSKALLGDLLSKAAG